MLLCNKKSVNKIYHTEHCGHIKNFNPDDYINYTSIAEATADGARPCKHCMAAMKMYRKEKKSIEKYCKKNNMLFIYAEKGYKVITPYGKWFLIGHRHKKIALYHENSDLRCKPSPIKGFHYQGVTYGSYKECLKYIKNHDMFRKNAPSEVKMPSSLKNREVPLVKGSHEYKKKQKYDSRVRRYNRGKRLDYLFEKIELERKERVV